jgi:hypothetical protein
MTKNADLAKLIQKTTRTAASTSNNIKPEVRKIQLPTINYQTYKETEKHGPHIGRKSKQ